MMRGKGQHGGIAIDEGAAFIVPALESRFQVGRRQFADLSGERQPGAKPA